MTFVTWILWILIWGVAGYFTVRFIQTRREIKRVEKEWEVYMIQRRATMANMYRSYNLQVSSDPFEDLSKKDV